MSRLINNSHSKMAVSCDSRVTLEQNLLTHARLRQNIATFRFAIDDRCAQFSSRFSRQVIVVLRNLLFPKVGTTQVGRVGKGRAGFDCSRSNPRSSVARACVRTVVLEELWYVVRVAGRSRFPTK